MRITIRYHFNTGITTATSDDCDFGIEIWEEVLEVEVVEAF